MAYVVRLSYRIRIGGIRTVSFIRAEYAPNNRANATRFDTSDQAGDAADVQKVNISGYARDLVVKIIPVKA